MLSLQKSLIIMIICILSVYLTNVLYLKYKYNKIENKKLKLNFMGSILTIFGILKLYNLEKFSQIFQKYDIISKNIPIYSYFYPFIEILLGISYIKRYRIPKVKIITIILMIISIVSVIISLIAGANLRCGCLGSFFHIPLSYVTLTENIIMLYMSYN